MAGQGGAVNARDESVVLRPGRREDPHMAPTMRYDELRARTPRDVFEDHLRLAAEHRFDEDIARNVSPDIVVLERRGVFRGVEGVRLLAQWLLEELGDAPYEYTNVLIEGPVAFLEWTSDGPRARVRDGADSFFIENGWIVAQTIHYTVEAK
ncbi:MAG TPA: nuclear transport factor 2 family protein [Acidimicrobiales bacterium]